MSEMSLHIQNLMTDDEKRFFMNRFCGNNPHYRGAQIADILETLYDTDCHIDKTDAMYEAHKEEIEKYPRGLYSMSVFVAIYTGRGTSWKEISYLMRRFNERQ